jgi:hypothetical protein
LKLVVKRKGSTEMVSMLQEYDKIIALVVALYSPAAILGVLLFQKFQNAEKHGQGVSAQSGPKKDLEQPASLHKA